jgi:hypothetical protein
MYGILPNGSGAAFDATSSSSTSAPSNIWCAVTRHPVSEPLTGAVDGRLDDAARAVRGCSLWHVGYRFGVYSGWPEGFARGEMDEVSHTVTASDHSFQRDIDGEGVGTVPRTTSAEIHRYKAYATRHAPQASRSDT